MVGKIVFEDEKCKDCPLADLSISTLYSYNRAILHSLQCSHEAACNRVEYIYETKEG